jgi:formylglycine-generating enzyme required for sulfatase activity
MMEFYCGLHLAKNSQRGWVTDTGNPHSSPRCGESVVRENVANAEWFEAFRFAIEMPASHRMDPVLLASLAELFEPVTQPVALRAATRATSDASGSNEPWLRPTELMYRAWCLLEELPPHECAQPSPQRLAGGERVLAAFRRQFQRQLEMPGDIDRVAREIRDGFVIVPALEQTELELTEGQAISIDAFKLGRTAITRAQYLLFDPSWKEVNANSLSDYEDQSPRCPAQFIDWYDAWCASRYFGARLPTEAEWEYACAAGSRKQFCRVANSNGVRQAIRSLLPQWLKQWLGVAHGEDLDDEEGLERVADFGRDWNEGPREVDVGRDLPGGGRRRLEPNAFGLIGMLGGVEEWCVSWDGDSVDEILSGADRNPVGPDRGSARVFRGGCFAYPADFCRPALRGRIAPSYRGDDLGFRLALSFVGVPADSRQDKNG